MKFLIFVENQTQFSLKSSVTHIRHILFPMWPAKLKELPPPMLHKLTRRRTLLTYNRTIKVDDKFYSANNSDNKVVSKTT